MTLSKLNVNKYGAFDKPENEHALRDKLQSLEDDKARLKHSRGIYAQLGNWKYVDHFQKQVVLVRSQIQSLKRKLHLQQEKLRFQQKLQERCGDSKVVTVLKYDPNAKWGKVIFNITSKYDDDTGAPPPRRFKDINELDKVVKEIEK